MKFSFETEFNISDLVYYRQKTSERVYAVFKGCVDAVYVEYWKQGTVINYVICTPGAGSKIVSSKDVFSTPNQAFN
jgi:hypothetical protein